MKRDREEDMRRQDARRGQGGRRRRRRSRERVEGSSQHQEEAVSLRRAHRAHKHTHAKGGKTSSKAPLLVHLLKGLHLAEHAVEALHQRPVPRHRSHQLIRLFHFKTPQDIRSHDRRTRRTRHPRDLHCSVVCHLCGDLHAGVAPLRERPASFPEQLGQMG